MNTKFITTEDESGKHYVINSSEIALIEETDNKYKRIITLSLLDKLGKPIKIESIHSIVELEEMLKKA